MLRRPRTFSLKKTNLFMYRCIFMSVYRCVCSVCDVLCVTVCGVYVSVLFVIVWRSCARLCCICVLCACL